MSNDNNKSSLHHSAAPQQLFERKNTQLRKSIRLNRREAADYLGLSLSWLDKARMTGTGPVYIAIGGRVVYDIADLDAFMAANKRVRVSGGPSESL